MKAWKDKMKPFDVVFSEPPENWIDEYEAVEVLPAADYEAMEAAIREAETALEYSRKRIAGKKQHDVIDGALARLRALGKG